MPSYIETEELIRDICYFYHEQACWGTGALYADLSFGRIYKLPYWSYIWFDSDSLSADEIQFVRDGCLMLVLTMCLDTIEGSGTYIVLYELVETCRREINSGVTHDVDSLKLIEGTNLALDIVEGEVGKDNEIGILSTWAKQTIVGRYFKTMSQFFQEVP